MLASASRKVLTVDGMSISPPYQSYRAARAALFAGKSSIANFQYGEPSWHLAHSAISAVAVLRPANQANLSGVLGALVTSTSYVPAHADPVLALGKVRNYIAHKGPTAAQKLQPVLQATNCRSVIEWMDQSRSGLTNFEEILSSLKVMGRQLAHS